MKKEPWRGVVDLMIERSVEPLKRVNAISREHSPEDRVCWHFMSQADLRTDDEAEANYYDAAARAFGGRDDCALERIAFGSFEVWDSILPTLDWLRRRAEQLARESDVFGAVLEGWSYEPVGYPEKEIPQAFGTPEEDEPDTHTT